MVIEAEHSASIIIRLISCAECRGRHSLHNFNFGVVQSALSKV